MNFHSHLTAASGSLGSPQSIRSRPRDPSLRVLVTSVRNSSITRRMPDTARRTTRSPVCVYGELS